MVEADLPGALFFASKARSYRERLFTPGKMLGCPRLVVDRLQQRFRGIDLWQHLSLHPGEYRQLIRPGAEQNMMLRYLSNIQPQGAVPGLRVVSDDEWRRIFQVQ